MCGIALKHAGHSITIIEKEDNVRQSHMAGVCLGVDAERFLARHDRLAPAAFTHECRRIQALKRDESIQVFINARRDITSWDVYYFRLRANFDGYVSEFYPRPPQGSATDGEGVYKGMTELLELKRVRNHDNDHGDGGEEEKMLLTMRDRTTQKVVQQHADLVIGADGPDSFIRSLYLPTIKRQYVGYIAWRGTVPESEISDSSRAVFRRSVTVHMMSRHHVIMYMIPGIQGSLEPGERYLNFLWYTNESQETLDEILIDGVDGHRHHNIVPAGRVRQDIWESRLAAARAEPLPGPFLEVIQKIRRPFIQVITEFITPQASFEDGRVLLSGDSLSLYRPHTAFSGTQAAFHANSIEDHVAGRISLKNWEERVLRYSRLHWAQSKWFGGFYQDNPLTAIRSACYYWWWCGVDRVRAWWKGEERLLRGWSLILDKYEDED